MNKAVWIGAGVVMALAAALLVFQGHDLFAQDGPGGPGGPGGPMGPGRGFPGMGRMGGTAMTAMGSHLFVLSGGTLYKVDPEKMKVAGTLDLRPEGDDRPGRDDGPGSGRKGW